MELSICIVNYETRDSIRRLLGSLFVPARGFSFEVHVVENHSTDGSLEMLASEFPQVRVTPNPGNLGFARAANQAMRASSGEYLLLCNPDVVVGEGTLERMLERMRGDPDIGLLGCRLVDEQGRTQGSCGRFPRTSTLLLRSLGLDKVLRLSARLRQRLELDYFIYPAETRTVDCLVGAFLLARRQAVERVGMLDEGFFLYGEDLDWCWRMREPGWKVVFCPEVSVMHAQGASARRRPLRSLAHFHLAMLRFFRKHQRGQVPFPFRWVVVLGIGLKFLMALFRHALHLRRAERIYSTLDTTRDQIQAGKSPLAT